jgi:hypothetical protein
MPEFYVIKGLSRALDGLVVEGHGTYEEFVQVDKLTNTNAILGDRNVSYTFPTCGLLIGKEYLEKISDPGKREFASDNPHGKLLFEGRYVSGNIEVPYARYEKCLQIAVIEKQGKGKKTLYSDYFYIDMDGVRLAIEELFAGKDDADIDDVVCELKNMKVEESDCG